MPLSLSSFPAPTLFRIVPLLACCWIPSPNLIAAQPDDVFRSFTSHIQQQIRSDKQGFVEAQTCTAWFYKQLHQKPPRPQAEGIVFHAPRRIRLQTLDTSDCQTRYPHGLEAAREDFSRTQSSLSLSLTFYEFALVGDRNDDERYSVSELKDMLESFGVSFNAVLAPAVHLAALNAKFDALRKSGGLDVLMASMGTLYDKGYRFTNQDRAALNRVAG